MRTPFAIDDTLRAQIEESGLLHKALPLAREDSVEWLGLAKDVVARRVLCDMGNMDGWTSSGYGSLSHTGRTTPAGNVSLHMEAPTSWHEWPADNPEGDYTPFFNQQAILEVNEEDWREYNRLRFWIYPDCEGVYAVNLALLYRNDGEVKIPDEYDREGRHEVNLVNRRWNECFLEIPDLPRDCITMLCFNRSVHGREMTMGDTWKFDFGEIYLERVSETEAGHGWLPAPGKIAYSMSGYEARGKKTAVMRGHAARNKKATVMSGYDARGETAAIMSACDELPTVFTLHRADGAAVYTGRVERGSTVNGNFRVLDFTHVTDAGEYYLSCGYARTRVFTIADGVWGPSVWKALNFIFCERCGMPVAGVHGSCHGDILATHDGKTMSYCGGWHDAGDLSQQTLQTADVVLALLQLREKARNASDTLLAARLEEEARWGLDFLLKCRFGDGNYASSAGILHWSDGYTGTFDDRPARVQSNIYDNIMYAGCYAFAATTLEDDEPMRDRLEAYARADFGFATGDFGFASGDFGFASGDSGSASGDSDIDKLIEKHLSEPPVFWEHSLNTSASQFMASLSWAASMLYRLTGEVEYAEKAAVAIEYVLSCQLTEPIAAGGDRAGLRGFFYRDKSREVIQHYTHQSRDAVYMQALQLLLETQPEHRDAGKWLGAVRLYGEYILNISTFSAPWDMLPSGVYHRDESADGESMSRQHLFPCDDTGEEFARQWARGIRLDDEHALRRFPIWFSFRGNAAVHLSTGMAAAICAGILKDDRLADIARGQLYWIVGKNPFCQSLMYGEGHNYPEQAVFLPGTMTGQLPVGVQTRDYEDVPYWPQANNATYKEAWLTVAGKWLSLVAELE